MHINESQIFETWAPIIESKTGIKDSSKLGWLSKYCHYHSLNESMSGNYAQIGVPPAGNLGGLMGNVSTPGSTLGVYGDSGSGDKFPSLLPLAIQVAARTIGFDIVNVIPMSGPTGVLTYLDYIYAGGNTNTTDKPTLIKLTVGGTYFNIGGTGAAVNGTTFYLGTTATSSSATAIGMQFVGNSRIDGLPIFRITSPISSDVWSGPTIAGAITNGAVIASGVTSGTAITGATAASPQLVKALEDHIQGFAGAGATNANNWAGPYANGTIDTGAMNRGTGETTYYQEMGLKAFTKFVEAKTFQVAASVTTEQIQDLNKQYGIDVVSMIENALVNEVSQSINKNILSKAFSLGWLNNFQMLGAENVTLNLTVDPGLTASTTAAYLVPDPSSTSLGTATVSCTVPAFSSFAGAGGVSNENLYTVQRRILSKVLAAGNVVAQRGRRGPANFIVTNLQLATAIQDNAQFTVAPITNAINQNNGSLYPVGTVAGMTVYVDPNMAYSDTRILVGRKGADEEPGLKFMPYMMAESIQTIAEGTMSPKVAVKSRYALVEAGQLPQTQYYTIFVRVGNISII
jgi:hypothetical protein